MWEVSVKILYTAVDTPIPGTHGGSVHAQELCRALARRGHTVHLIAPPGISPNGTASAAAAGDGLHLHHVRQPPRFLEWAAVGKVRELATALSPDVVVERFYTFGGAGIWAAHSLGLPAVLEVNSPARPFPSLRDTLDRLTLVRPVDRWRRRLLRWSDAVYATSRHLVPPEMQGSVTVVTNGVDTERFRPGPARPTSGPLRCVYVSSFRSWHGASNLVEAVALCVARHVDLRVTCVGRGPRLAEARRATRHAGLDGTIRFVGDVPAVDVPRYLAGADVGLAPFSPTEFNALRLGWFWSPIKIFEYLAAGLAVVTADLPELRALLPDTVARFYTPGAVGELADELEQLATHTEALGPVRQIARELAETRYTWGHQASVVEGLLEDVLARRRARGRDL